MSSLWETLVIKSILFHWRMGNNVLSRKLGVYNVLVIFAKATNLLILIKDVDCKF